MAKLELLEEEKPKIDPEFEEITEGEEETEKSKLQTKWARLEAMVGTEKRIAQVAEDLVEHFHLRINAMDGTRLIAYLPNHTRCHAYGIINSAIEREPLQDLRTQLDGRLGRLDIHGRG